MAESTTLIFVPGAWHGPDYYDPVVERLEAVNYKTDKVHLPSVGPSEYLLNFDADVAQIRSQIERAVDAGQKVVLIVHSYGGLPGSEAIKGLDIKTREKNGLPGGVTHLFYCSSFIIKEGDSLIGAFGGSDLPWFVVSDDKLQVNPADPVGTFYNDLTPAQIETCLADIKPHSYQTMHSPCTYAAWRDVPSTYMYCLQDAAIPIEIQKGMVEGTAGGYDIKTETVDASHSPFLSKPDEVTAAIRRAAGEVV
ncbi:uncharacterized protein N7518_002700 [Penicillium psychrosexuale]|uniref:uncharacterized protein n=1 Tax=Penicillium psychrosexuale TaxID=1002107 RepID=UPI002544EF20|nr:uncharacterized protein N7518_002700 [Penicillium psychrosexuale]KAJ5800632.1 hypothetical protein N7518_002700 [Penicillium psychrosexuale]